MSNFDVVVSEFNKEIIVPTSKSYANRLLILAAIDKRDIKIKGLPSSTDVLAMIDCLVLIGLVIERINEDVIVKGSFPECEVRTDNIIKIMTGDGGTTNRFILSLLARGRNSYELVPKGHMKNRPMRPLIKALKDQNVSIDESEDYWLRVSGPITRVGNVSIDCESSTQFATSLLLSTCDLNVEINLKNLNSSKVYYDLTAELVKKFRNDELKYTVPVDFSSLSYPLALAAHSGRVLVKNCSHVDEYQADSIFISILRDMGAIVKFTNDGLVCEHKELRGVVVDGGQCPDIVPTIAFLAAYALGDSKICNIDVLRHKECDRVTELLKILDVFSISYELVKNDLLIKGGHEYVTSKNLQVPDDHRMVMVGYLFLRVNGGGTVNNAEHVNKSFPKFYNTMI